MGAMRTLRNKIDPDAVARVLSGTKPKKSEREKRTSRARAADTYRGARRNECLRSDPKSTWGPDWYYG